MLDLKGTTLLIRPLLNTEVPDLLSLIRAKAEFDGSLASLVATTDSLREALFSERPQAHALVAELDGKLVGMAVSAQRTHLELIPVVSQDRVHVNHRAHHAPRIPDFQTFAPTQPPDLRA